MSHINNSTYNHWILIYLHSCATITINFTVFSSSQRRLSIYYSSQTISFFLSAWKITNLPFRCIDLPFPEISHSLVTCGLCICYHVANLQGIFRLLHVFLFHLLLWPHIPLRSFCLSCYQWMEIWVIYIWGHCE